jgi:superfamily II DNA/RNA helicase
MPQLTVGGALLKESKFLNIDTRMRSEGFPAMGIHGDKQQKERDWVLGEFRSGKTWILVT